MTISYEIPTYIQKNSGYLNLNFDANVVFMNGIFDSNIVSFPSSLSILNANNNSLLNSIEYYSNSSILSVKSISIKICSLDSPCSNNLVIKTLRKAFNTLSSAFQYISVTTLYKQAISSSIFDCSSFLPKTTQSIL
jgi:hypothetical protein